MEREVRKRIEAVRGGKVPEGYIKENHQLRPNDWKYEKIGRYLVAYDQYSNDTEHYTLATSSRQGLLPQTDYYNDQRFDETAGGFHVVPEGYVTYRHMSDDDVFKFNVNQFGAPVLVSPEYPVFTTGDGLNQALLIEYLNGMKEFRAFCRAQKKGSTRTRMYFSCLGEFMMPIPPVAEQGKIAKVLAAFDHVIELKRNYIEVLQNKKRGYLAKLFPQSGSDVPEVRFPGFTDNWERCKLGDLAIFNPKADLPDVFEYVDLGCVVGTEMISHRTESKETAPSRAQRLAQTGDLFYQTVRPYQKNNYLFEKFDKDYVFSTGYAQMRPLIDGRFLLYLVQNENFVKVVLDNCTGTSYPAINSNDLAHIEAYWTNDEQEQMQIGKFFRDIDRLITLHVRELEAEQQRKKVLMQLLLTGLVRVKA